MARSYTECKSSCQEDYITAFNWLKKCKELTGTYEVDEFYFKLENDISKYKLDEKKVFKSFFRKINTERAGQEIEQPKQNEIGKPQLAFLNLVIDNCTKLSIQLNGIKAKEKEWNEIEECKKTALFYKKTLEDLVGLDFDNPNEFILSFCKENGADYKDKQVQDSFIKIRDEYIEKINVFYEKNFGAEMRDQLSGNKSVINNENINKKIPKQTNSNNKKSAETSDNKKVKELIKEKNQDQEKIKKSIKSQNKGLSLTTSLMIVLGSMLIIYIIQIAYKYFFNSVENEENFDFYNS